MTVAVNREATVVLFENQAGLVLAQGQGMCQLPRVRIADAGTFSRSVARTVRQAAGVSIFVLDWLDAAGDLPVCLARLDRMHSPLPNGFAWMEVENVGKWRPDDVAILARSRQHQAMNDATPQHPFHRFEILDELREWYRGVLDRNQLEEKEIEHWQSGGDDALLRIATDRRTVWLKAVGDEYRSEPSISSALARMSPGDFPQVLAVNGKWNAMLLEGIAGPTLNEVLHRDAWLTTAERLAEIQQKFVGAEAELLRAGCADWRLPRLLEAIPGFFEAMVPVMCHQESSRQPSLTAAELAALSRQAEQFCRLWMSLSVPDTLVHGNFSPHNVIWSGGKPVFLDWAFGLVGFPFLSEEYFRRRMEREHPEFRSWSGDLRAAYYAPWERLLGRRTLERAKMVARSAAPLVAAINLHAQDPEGWRSVPMRAPVLRSLVRLFAREVRPFAGEWDTRAAVIHA